jgi:hypothetical protein
MLTGKHPHAAIFKRCVFQSKPKTRDALGYGIQKTAVLVPSDLAADAGLLEYQHRLQ